MIKPVCVKVRFKNNPDLVSYFFHHKQQNLVRSTINGWLQKCQSLCTTKALKLVVNGSQSFNSMFENDDGYYVEIQFKDNTGAEIVNIEKLITPYFTIREFST